MYIPILIVLLVFFSFNLYTNYFHYKWFFLTMISGACLSCYLYSDFGPFVPLLVMYCLGSATYLGMFNLNKHFIFPEKGLNPVLAFQNVKASLAIVSLGVIYIFLDRVDLTDIITAIKYLLIVNCIWTLLPNAITDRLFVFTTEKGARAKIQGFGANISVNATFLSLMAPFVLVDFNQNITLNSFIIALTLLAIIKTTAMTGLAAFIISMGFFFVCKYQTSIVVIIGLVVGSLVIVLIADKLYMQARKRSCAKKDFKIKRLWDLSGRLEIWKFSREKVTSKMGRLFGIGIGSYHYVMPALQTKDFKDHIQNKVQERINLQKRCGSPMKNEDIQAYAKKVQATAPNKHRYIWMHSDIMQFVIEGGYLGGVLLLFSVLSIIYLGVTTQNYVFLTFLIAYGINSATNFPSHLAPDSLLAIIMLKYLTVA